MPHKQGPAILCCIEDDFCESPNQIGLQRSSKFELQFRQEICFITAITLNHRLVCVFSQTQKLENAEFPSDNSKHVVLLCTIIIGAKRYCIKHLPGGAAGREFISSNSEH